MSEPEADLITLTQIPIETPENYLDGNPDYWAARDFALAHGFPRRSIAIIEDNKLVLLRDEPLPPWIDRKDKTQQPLLGVAYVVNTKERGFLIVQDPIQK